MIRPKRFSAALGLASLALAFGLACEDEAGAPPGVGRAARALQPIDDPNDPGPGLPPDPPGTGGSGGAFPTLLTSCEGFTGTPEDCCVLREAEAPTCEAARQAILAQAAAAYNQTPCASSSNWPEPIQLGLICFNSAGGCTCRNAFGPPDPNAAGAGGGSSGPCHDTNVCEPERGETCGTCSECGCSAGTECIEREGASACEPCPTDWTSCLRLHEDGTATSECLPPYSLLRCDGQVDCAGNADEAGCDQNPPPGGGGPSPGDDDPGGDDPPWEPPIGCNLSCPPGYDLNLMDCVCISIDVDIDPDGDLWWEWGNWGGCTGYFWQCYYGG